MRIGIITEYYRSKNYGGNLQSYALCAAIKKLNLEYKAEQISYQSKPRHNTIRGMTPLRFFRKATKHIWHKTGRKLWESFRSIKERKYMNLLMVRNIAIEKFNEEEIPHSKVYTANTISAAVNDYDVFITGSDQVWNPSWYNPAYRLDFVPGSKVKLSYAASISRNALSDEEKTIFQKSLVDYTGISVREEMAVDLLSPLVTQKVEWVLDPTLLLSQKDWDEICKDRLVEERYVFCYFLGDDCQARAIATAYSKAHGYALVTLPFLNGKPRRCDKDFGTYRLYDVSPADFISLIKHAEFVFTDSFHATVFSGIYERQYFVFDRSVSGHSMGSRLCSLLSLYEARERFGDSMEKRTIEYIESLPPIDYSRQLKLLKEKREESLAFLKRNLIKAEDKCEQSN